MSDIKTLNVEQFSKETATYVGMYLEDVSLVQRERDKSKKAKKQKKNNKQTNKAN